MIGTGGLARRYALALFSSAMNKGKLGDVYEDAKQLRTLLEITPEFKNYILSPQVRTDEKINLIRQALQSKASDISVRFLELLVEKERFEYTDEIASVFINLYEKHMGQLRVEVTTAIPLEKNLEDRLVEKLEQQTSKKITLIKNIDPAIIGGVILKIENKIINGSIKYHLSRMGSNLREAKVY